MKTHLALSGLLGMALCATATANTFSVSGPGGAIPDCTLAPGVWNAAPTWPVLTSNVSVLFPVTNITAVKLQGLNHTFRGDIMAFLTDPGGTRYNVIVRPGFTGANSGDGGNYNLGDYTFVETGGASIAQGATNIAPGTYNQYLNTGAGQWTSGTYVINNTPLSGISGAAGTWSLTLVDWWSADTGSITGWTLEGNDTSPSFTNFCDPGVGGILPCPCGNPPSGSGRGCDNFGALSGGASLTAVGTSSLSADSLVLTVSGENSTSLTVFWQGHDPVMPTGVVNAAGIRCVNQTLKRLYNGNASGGSITRPGMGDPTISARSAAVSDPIGAGEVRNYFAIYRDPGAAGPCGLTSSTVNVSNAGSCTWVP